MTGVQTCALPIYEVSRNMGSIEAQKYTRLNARKEACIKINKMFELNIDVEYREDVKIMQEINDAENESVGDENE